MSKYQSPLSTLLEEHENRHRIIRTNNMQQSPNNMMTTSINMNMNLNGNNSNNKYIKFSYPSEALTKKASDEQRQELGRKDGEGKLSTNNGRMGNINTIKYVKTPYMVINSNHNSNNNSNNSNNNHKPNSVMIQPNNPAYLYNGKK